MSTAGTLISRLDGVIPRGAGRWISRCPAHDDKAPSLSIRETEDKVLVHCFAGCTAEDVLTAVDLTWHDLYTDSGKAAYRAACAEKSTMQYDQIEIERWVIKIGADLLRDGKELSVEDTSRIEVARLRLEAAV